MEYSSVIISCKVLYDATHDKGVFFKNINVSMSDEIYLVNFRFTESFDYDYSEKIISLVINFFYLSPI